MLWHHDGPTRTARAAAIAHAADRMNIGRDAVARGFVLTLVTCQGTDDRPTG
jgi:hypothetical protein